jgi:hypothetical protein
MSAEPAPLRRLVAVDADTGEAVHPEVAMLQERVASLEQALKEAELELRAKRAQITVLKKNKAEERSNYPRRADVVRVHAYWQARMGHRQALTADRFDAVRAMLEETRLELADGKARRVPAFRWPEDFKLAVDGAWFDPFCKPMKNGRVKRFNDLTTIFRDGKSMQYAIERAPSRDNG